jgi:TatA/E family protein of Tat protein translocase
MFNLDPGKLLIIAVVAVVLLGPDKLPQVARQVGAAWRTFLDFRRRMETEVRGTLPDLPSSAEIARLSRSPTALLNRLSSMGEPGVKGNGRGRGRGRGNGNGNGWGRGMANGNGTGLVGDDGDPDGIGPDFDDDDGYDGYEDVGADDHIDHTPQFRPESVPVRPPRPVLASAEDTPDYQTEVPSYGDPSLN